MAGWLVVSSFSLFMLLGSYGIGSLPLFMVMSEEKLHLVSVMGAGLLLGTALAVILPEGLQTLVRARQELNETHQTDVHEHKEALELDKTVGFSLVLGFLFMLLVDQLASSSMNRAKKPISLDSEHLLPSPSPSSSTSSTLRRSSVNWTTTLGLVVHAAADGIALGAASSTSNANLELIVFLAIMLHKGPAAFGLSTFLLHEGLERNRVRRHLLIFSLAAPSLAILTFVCLNKESSGEEDQHNALNATGVAMLFSAGTFLYVATVHVLPEVTSRHNKTSNNGHHSHGSSLNISELSMLVLGLLLPPLLLSMGHHH